LKAIHRRRRAGKRKEKRKGKKKGQAKEGMVREE